MTGSGGGNLFNQNNIDVGTINATTLNVSGVSTMGPTTVSSFGCTGNAAVGGTLGVQSSSSFTGTIGCSTISVGSSATISRALVQTELQIPVDTAYATPSQGDIRFNSTTKLPEYYYSSGWNKVAPKFSFRAYQLAAGLALPASTATQIKLDTVVYDTASGFNTTTWLYTIPTGGTGIWQFNATTRTTTGLAQALIVNVNATSYYLFDSGSVNVTSCSGTLELSVTAGDTIKMFILNNSGGAGTASNGNNLVSLSGNSVF